MTPMLELMENVASARKLFQSALQAYLDACSTFRKISMLGEFPLAKLESFTSDELAFFTSHEGKLQTARALLGNVRNHAKPAGALPSEALSRIFHFVPLEPLYEGYPSYFRFPKRLEYISHTCSRWRQAALDAPMLWTSVCFNPRIIANRGLTSRAMVYASRAGVLPLKIDITNYVDKCGPATLESCGTKDGVLLEFLALVSHRISSIEMYGPLHNSEVYGKLLETCLAGATPSVLTHLGIGVVSCVQNIAVGSSQDSSQKLDVALDIPAQRLEDILNSVTSLSLRDAHFRWASKAFHGLVELQLGFDARSSFDRSDVKIPEFHLRGILSSSPGLQRFAFNMQVQESSSSDDPVTPVALEDLEVLDLRGLNHSHLGLVLRLVAPSSRLSIVWLTLADAYVQDSHLNKALKSFFGRVKIPNLGLTFLSSLQWLEILGGLVNNLSVLVIQRVIFPHVLLVPQHEDPPTPLDFVGRLHLSNCILSLTPLSWVLDMCRPHTLALWKCSDDVDRRNSLSGHSVAQEEVIPSLLQECPYVNILENDKPDPVWDWY